MPYPAVCGPLLDANFRRPMRSVRAATIARHSALSFIGMGTLRPYRGSMSR